MTEWIVRADEPTRAMERMRTGEVVRCEDCECFMSDDDTGCWCVRLSREVGPRGFCAWGERRADD